jgi:TolA-binding protein
MNYSMQARARLTGRTALVATLFCSAAATMVAVAPVTAQAKARHHRHHAVAAESGNTELREEVSALKSEVQSLEAWRDTEAANQAQTQQQLADANARAAAAEQRAANAEAQATAANTQVQTAIKTIPAQEQAAAKAAAPKPGWEGSTTISGRVYADASNINMKVNGLPVTGGPNGTNFDIKRFYLGVDHKFNDVFSANVTTDFNYDSGPAGATQLYIKKAYLQAKLNDAFIVRFGSADLPWVPFVEDLYGYRYVENVMIDRDKFGTSADWGVHALGKVPLGNMASFSYAVAAINGMGYKKPGFIAGVNRSQGIDLEGRASVNFGPFTGAVGGYTGKLGNNVLGTSTFNSAQRFDALLAYTDKRIRVGGEYFYAKAWNDVKQSNPLLVNSSDGFSAFGSFKFTPEIAVFGRYDWVNPTRVTASTRTDHYYNIGVSWSPAKIVDIALLYKHDTVANGTLGTQNGTIGGSVNGTYDEVGVFTQYRW